MLKRIVLHLARGKDWPDGSDRHGYEIVAPLDDAGTLDSGTWKRERARCRVRRFWGDEPDRFGRLIHKAGGAGGATWRIDYDPARDGDDETGYRLGSHTFRANDYVSIRDDGGVMHTFRVAEVRPA